MGLLVELVKAVKAGDAFMILRLPHRAEGKKTLLFGTNGPEGDVLHDSPTLARFRTEDVRRVVEGCGIRIVHQRLTEAQAASRFTTDADVSNDGNAVIQQVRHGSDGQ